METCKASQASADNFRMVDVGGKQPARRRAIAQGRIRMGAEAFELVVSRKLPKGDALALAEMAGILAAKKTPELIPLCHPLPLEQVEVRCEPEGATRSVKVICTVTAFAKTGVEMEALAAVNGALLAIYDLVKQVDPALSIGEIRLNVKEGGKSGVWVHPEAEAETATGARTDAEPRELPLAGVRAAVLTVSDRASRGEAEDRSGPAAAKALSALGAEIRDHHVVPDEKSAIAAKLRAWSTSGIQMIITTGGTGLSPRDVTPEAVSETCDRLIPGFGELLRKDGARHTEMSWLSRSVAGQLGETLVVALPGSPKAVSQGLDAIAHLLPHAFHVSAGGDHAR